MKKHILLMTILVLIFCLIGSGCSTSMVTNAREYYNNTTAILSQLTAGTRTIDKQADVAIPLNAPSNFSVDEAGNYAFDGVADADYYLIYFCAPDAAEDDKNFLYSSEPIPAHADSNSYSGVCRDVIKAPYGEYQVRVLAVPALGDNSHSMSKAVSVAYTQVGTQSAPAMEYFWDPFTNTMTLQLANVGTYANEAYPDRIDVTITNVDNEEDHVALTLEGIADGNQNTSTEALTKGETYRISAVAVSDAPYVTNKTSDEVIVAEELMLGDLNILSAGYSYWHSSFFSYPLLWENFDLKNGGSSPSILSMVTYEEYTLDCTPVKATAGSAYSYSYTARPFAIVSGMLELRNDGTVLCYNKNSPPVADAEISGIWVDNGDGTATICFSNSTWHTT